MNYNKLYDDYMKYVGMSNKDVSNYIEENNLDENDGMHMWFDFVVTPFVLNAISSKNINVLTKTFEFVEKCLKTNNKDITEVIEFSLLEGIVAEIGQQIDDIDIFFGDETKKTINNIKKYIFNN